MLFVAPSGAVRSPRERQHAVSEKEGSELLLQRLASRFLFEAGMEGVDTRNRNHVYAKIEQVTQDLLRQYIAGGLHDQMNATLVPVFGEELLERRIEDRFTNRIEQ